MCCRTVSSFWSTQRAGCISWASFTRGPARSSPRSPGVGPGERAGPAPRRSNRHGNEWLRERSRRVQQARAAAFQGAGSPLLWKNLLDARRGAVRYSGDKVLRGAKLFSRWWRMFLLRIEDLVLSGSVCSRAGRRWRSQSGTCALSCASPSPRSAARTACCARVGALPSRAPRNGLQLPCPRATGEEGTCKEVEKPFQ